MAEVGTISWPYDCFGASSFMRTDRVNVPTGEFPEVWGFDGSIENACRPLSGMRFIAELAGVVTPITSFAGYSGSLTLKNSFPVQLRVGDDEYVDGFVYRVSDANGISRVFFKWRKPNATSYQSDLPIKLQPTVGGAGTDPRSDGNQPMDVVVDGKFAYVMIAGSTPMMFYFTDNTADPSTLTVVESTGPGPEPLLTVAPYTIASEDTNGTDNSYRYSGTNSYANLTGAADPGTNFLNLTEPTTQNEKQSVTIYGTPTGGTFTLTFQGQTTAGIAYNANAATVQTALEALSNIAVGDVTVTGGPGPGTAWVVEFKVTYAGVDVEEMIFNGASLTGGTNVRGKVRTTQRVHVAQARLYPLSFFDITNTPPNNVTNGLVGPTDFQQTGSGFYQAGFGVGYPVDPIFDEFCSQKKILGPTLNEVPDSATDSLYVQKIGPMDSNRRYGFLIQFWDQFRTGRVSKVSKVVETAVIGTGEEPYRAPVFETKQLSGTESPGTTPASSLYLVAAGHRCGFMGLEVIYNTNLYDTVMVYRTVADNPKGILSLDGVFQLTNKFETRNQRKSAGVDLASPWKRAFFILRTPESQIAQQPSFDPSSFLMDEEMPQAGSAIIHEGTMLVGNVGSADVDASGMGVVRWSSTTRHAMEVFSPFAKFILRAPGEEVLRFVHNGPNVLAFSRQNCYLFRKEGVYMRGYHVAGGIGITNRRAACEVGSTTYALTPSGLYTITQNGGISAVRAVQSLLMRNWADTLDKVHLAFDQEGKCVILHNTQLYETCIMWLETSRITLLKDTIFHVCNDGPCPRNAQNAGQIQQRACFFQQVNPTAGTYRWRIFTLDTSRDKRIVFSGHDDHQYPMLSTMHPQGVQGVQEVYASFSSGSSLKVKAAGMHTTNTFYLEKCRLYVARSANSALVGKKATIEQFSLNTDAGASHTLTLGSDASELYGLTADDELVITPVYCLALGWAAGVLTPEGEQYGPTRDKFRERLVSSIFAAFADVSGPPSLTNTACTSGNGYSNLARFAGVIYDANDTTPDVRAFPTETDETDKRSIVDEASIVGAPINRPYGYKTSNLYPGIETFIPNMDFQLLSFIAEGRVLEAKRPGRATTGGITS